MTLASKRWSTHCLELISSRIDHLDAKHAAIIEKTLNAHEKLEQKLSSIEKSLLKIEESIVTSDGENCRVITEIETRLDKGILDLQNHSYNYIQDFEKRIGEYVVVRIKDLTPYSSNSNDSDVDALSTRYSNLKELHEECNKIVADAMKRIVTVQQNIIEAISFETRKLHEARDVYAKIKTLHLHEITREFDSIKAKMIEHIDDMKTSREHFDDVILERLEQKINPVEYILVAIVDEGFNK
ncbi:hypothetical protein BdWA1_001129 [Babesia duncani]|uniref:Uncharacterized protein n=1 Tax=Babesia duncani TaxID=323732 RepID=A0AAD9PNQ4_9APIC|nr:hypothetical protein BdWA1_001129 [Babesia duncani]